MNQDAVNGLREAIRLSPDNAPLRMALADLLLSSGKADEAEKEYRAALHFAADDPKLKLGLANAFFQQGKNSQALVIVEDMIKQRSPAAAAATAGRTYLLHARLLERSGDTDAARRQYRKAIEADPSVEDPELARRLGVESAAASAFDGAGDSEVTDGKVRVFADGAGGNDASRTVERPTMSFADVGGLEGLKDEIRMKIIHPLTPADLYKAYGKAIGGGILMYGPPGCGKTFLARATAGEIKSSFLSIGINDVLDMWLGNSERNLHELFEQARRSRPCVLFFDEVDALAASRTDMRTSAGRHLINQFLSELDGVQTSNEGLLVLAATNAPWHIDPAFRRPGRFDRILFVPPPDAPARASILRAMLRGKPVDNIDHDHVAKKTDGFSGADLKAVVDAAIEAKLREAMKAGVPKPLTTKDLLSAAAGIKPSTREWFSTARNYALYSNQGGVYDDILKYLKL